MAPFHMQTLREFTLGTPQQVGMMTVIPLLGEDASLPLGSFSDLSFSRTSSYGTMVFQNKSEHPVIVPNGYSVITNQAAQDHGLPFSVLVKPGEQSFSNACCIEQRQPGAIDGSQVSDFRLLPLAVRKKHFLQYVLKQGGAHRDFDFGRLWTIISDFQSKLVGKNEAHLVYFFTKFVSELSKFNAEFESVQGQRGAIILLGGKIAGIEIMPTQRDWAAVWEALIRDCYGSELIRLTQLKLTQTFEEVQENKWDLSSCASVEEMESYIASRRSAFLEKVEKEVERVLQLPQTEHTHYADLRMTASPWEGVSYHLSSAKDVSYLFESYKAGEEWLYLSALAN